MLGDTVGAMILQFPQSIPPDFDQQKTVSTLTYTSKRVKFCGVILLDKFTCEYIVLFSGPITRPQLEATPT